ncbi:MAG: hypothetical protein SO130_11060 [Agathobacter sp.]|nr:hypothetical protein [Agathobacter sp.]
MLYIEVPDMNDSMSSVTIDDKEYWLRFTYNEKHDYWSFGLYDENEDPIIAMTRIVPNFPIMFFYTDTDIPDGIFGCLSDIDTVGRNAFIDKTAEFVYIPNAELKEDDDG